VGTWDWDVPNDRVYCNAQFAKLFSIDAESATAGAPLDRFTNQIHSEDRHRVNENIGGALASGGGFADEFRVVQGDGSPRWVTARGRCHLDADGRPSRFPGVVFDITERKQAEEELSRSNLELTRVNRELEEFAYVASHDLQEPLRMVNIYTQLLLRDRGAEEAKLNQYADFIQLGVTRMETLIRDLLTFSRAVHADELPVGTADLSDSLREALTVMKSRIEESGSVIAAGPLPTVRGDVSQLAHVFQNLISNALKYRKKQFAPQIDITAEQRGDSWIITVSDNGIGFKQEHAERIFGLFKRLHNEEYPGTGLGLAICRRIVERYGGRIWAEGKPGEGATFRFSLRASA
jgi:PAS domain S-box-containing protein